MPMTVVQIRVMWVLVAHWFMPVRVRMRLRHRAIVCMPVVLVMGMGMVVLEALMVVLMIVPLGHVQVQPDRHQHPRAD